MAKKKEDKKVVLVLRQGRLTDEEKQKMIKQKRRNIPKVKFFVSSREALKDTTINNANNLNIRIASQKDVPDSAVFGKVYYSVEEAVESFKKRSEQEGREYQLIPYQQLRKNAKVHVSEVSKPAGV